MQGHRAELPLNGESEVALTMAEKQCTQCHNLETRNITTTPGIKIDHKIHTEKDIQCPECHNRVAHNDIAAKPVLNDPKLFRRIIDAFVARWKGERIDKVVAIESRGFIFGAPVAYALGERTAPGESATGVVRGKGPNAPKKQHRAKRSGRATPPRAARPSGRAPSPRGR